MRKKDRIDKIIAQGAFVVTHKPTPTPVVPAPEEAVEQVVEAPQDEVSIAPVEQPEDVNVIADALNKHFKKLDISKPDPSRANFREIHAVGDVGTRQEGVVVVFYPEKEVGFIRLKKYGSERSGLFFHTQDIVEGSLIGFGSQVSCLVSLPMRDRESLTAREIRVIQP